MSESTVKVAAVQAAPVFLDLEASLQKALGLIEKAAAEGARLIVFPEAFLPAWPAWVDEVLPGEDAAWHLRLLEQSVVVPGPVTERLATAARAAGAQLVMGIDEREAHGGTVYNTLLYFDADGRLLGKHRKLVPTHAERLVWGMGDGSDLEVHQTMVGRVGGLICWENYMPLARFALHAQGIDIWVAPTLATHEPWVATMRHIAREGVCHVIGVAPAARFSDVPDTVPDRDRLWRGADPHGDWMLDGYSVIVDPAARSSPARWSARRASCTPTSTWTPPGPATACSTRWVTTTAPTCSAWWSTTGPSRPWCRSGWMVASRLGPAILRYRLYDLDRIISRTLTYGLLTLLLGGGYAVLVLGLGQLLRRRSSLSVAAATLVVAALFQPIQASLWLRAVRQGRD
jgi:nitrilase